MSRSKPLYDGIKLNCTIVSDTHIDIKHPFPFVPKFYLKRALSDSQNNSVKVDAFITVGDTTSRGSTVNWDMTKECFSKYKPAEKILLTIGNHDGWNDDGQKEALKNYLKYTEEICSVKRDKPYFSEVINGYHLIFLGSDDEAGCEAQISDEQLEWFRNEMNEAGESGLPIFVFCHQSLNEKHGLPRTWDREEKARDPMEGGLGERSDEVEKILKSYKNVYYFSGHSHMGICGENMKKTEGYSSIEQEGELTLINFPSLACGNHHGETNEMGAGMQLEVYDDKVVIRPRSYSKHSFIKKVAIKDGKPYFEKKN